MNENLPSSPILLFSLITTIYYIIKYNLDDNGMDNTYFIMYLLIIIISHFFVNLNMTRALCGSNQWDTTIYVTVVPWLVIFGFLYIGLKTFPSWLMPFSNTFGYGLAILGGLTETTEKLFKSTTNAKNDKELAFLEKIYTDKSLIINEITVNNFTNFWENMKGLFRDDVINDSANIIKNKLKSLVKLKELTAEYIWHLFAGLLITSISYNFIIGSSCKKSVQDMQNSHKNKFDSIENMKKSEEKRLYIINE